MSCPFSLASNVLSNPYVGAIAAAGAIVWVGKSAYGAWAAGRKKAKTEARLAKQKKDTVYLYQFSRLKHTLNASPFCTTVETYLRLTGVPHEVKVVADPNFSPTGRMPYVELNGVGMADSDSIVSFVAKEFGHATPADADTAVSMLVVRSLSRSTRLHIIRHKWVNNIDATFRDFSSFMTSLPTFVVRKICNSIRKDMIGMLDSEGQGDLSDAEFYAQFLEEVKAVEGVLERRAKGSVVLTAYAVAVAFAWLQAIVAMPPHDVSAYALKSPVVMSFLREVEAKAYPDADDLAPERPARRQ